MSVVSVIDTITRWTQDNICSKIELKVPPKAGDPNDASMEYAVANPVAFPMYVPTSDKLPPDMTQFPSICIRFMDGEDDLVRKTGTMSVQMCLAVWDPGLHGPDVFHPRADGKVCRQPKYYTEFQRNGSGWRDVWNLCDIVLREIESTSKIGSMTIDQSSVRYAPLTEQNSIPDFYPFWFAQVSFNVTYSLQRHNPDTVPEAPEAVGGVVPEEFL